MQHNMPGICTRQSILDEAPKQLEQVSKARARVCVCVHPDCSTRLLAAPDISG
jgi:quinolinate synthase